MLRPRSITSSGPDSKVPVQYIHVFVSGQINAVSSVHDHADHTGIQLLRIGSSVFVTTFGISCTPGPNPLHFPLVPLKVCMLLLCQ